MAIPYDPQPLIRPATAHDADRMRAIANAAYAGYVARIGRQPAPMTADYGAEIAAHDAVVLEIAGELHGYMIGWAEFDAYFIDNIAIDPAQQGAGLGRHLISYAANRARRLGLPSLRLYTNEAMTENLSMYAHIGFVETHRMSEKGFRRVYMRWTLTSDT